ncbi:hypothetical protein [Lysobacter auxotrophicus]|uniref:Uncharacterized protein n=1 Tax=Lysobacter auxotrophicus TaxID=2992573 RepID=A0ABM8DG71_9GAMM|nr:hypothetical protein [Lysobacter auxotrophicus]BDU17563.1 hypothetical protein LA521A_27640 [Lysobacter auxotrophicus]
MDLELALIHARHLSEVAMWICIRCKAEVTPDDSLPVIDDFGVCFICPQCGRRNRLKNIGENAEIVLMQIDPPE